MWKSQNEERKVEINPERCVGSWGFCGCGEVGEHEERGHGGINLKEYHIIVR